MACIPGPFDKRRLRTSCAGCRALHIKCEGGHPCHRCASSGLPCEFEATIRQPICFRSSAYNKSKYTSHPSRIMRNQNENHLWHFFHSFLPRNDFTARSSDEQQILKLYLHESAGLKNAIIAIGALELSRYTKISYSLTAAAHYKQAVSSLRVKLRLSARIDDATLWSALLLAMFELMVDTTGTGFMLHFTNGLPALLRQRNFDLDEANRYQTLIHTIQMLEIMRSAPFWTNKESMLEDPRWQQMIQRTAGENSESQTFTVLYDLMRRFLKLNNTVFAIVLRAVPEDMTLEDRQQLNSMAKDGLDLYHQLEMWYMKHSDHTETWTPLSLLSSIYHCTLTISIAEIFSFPHFAYCELSVLSSSTAILSTQIDELCMLLKSALRTTNLAGILMLWPLRVAGSKSIRKEQAHQVLEMLREIRQRGFAVAQSYEDLLTKQWEQRFLL